MADCAVCHLCDAPITTAEEPHDAHRSWCAGDGCDCDYQVHPDCCLVCNPPVIPGQVEAFPLASTRGLPKKAAV